jgi:hypothetical protein
MNQGQALSDRLKGPVLSVAVAKYEDNTPRRIKSYDQVKILRTATATGTSP